jgi:hypothetical protein
MTTSTAPISYLGAGLLLESLATQDFDSLRRSFEPDVRMRALVPTGLRVLEGPDQVADRFAAWFGDTQEFQTVDATHGDVAGPLHHGGWSVEQQAYADCSVGGLLRVIDLVCSGYRAERTDKQ